MVLVKGRSRSSVTTRASRSSTWDIEERTWSGSASGGAVVSSVSGLAQTAVVTNPSSATDTLSLLPTQPVPQQTHITVAPTPTAPACLGKIRYLQSYT